MKRFIFFLLITSIFGCKKRHEPLHGTLEISGKITDIISNQPIAGATVELTGIRTRFGHPEYDGVATDTTDALGNYSFSYNADGEYEFQVYARKSPWYMGSGNVAFQNDIIKSLGTHILDLKCHRTAFAKINLVNTPPVDTISSIYFTGYNSIDLFDFYKDTILYLELSAAQDQETRIVHKSSDDNATTTLIVHVAPWDTIVMNRNY